jgi:CheY-like chemotaxis protein/DnaJ-domain-containing protein 1
MGGTVLVVDDDRNIHGFFRALLEPEGLTVLCEADGQWALKVLERRPVDFVVLGNLGHAPDEHELARRIRRSGKGKHLPLLMVGGQGARADALEASKARLGLVDFLSKPLDVGRVYDALRSRFELDYPSVVLKARAQRKPAARLDDHDPAPAERAQAVTRKAPAPAARGRAKTRAARLSCPEDALERDEVEREARAFESPSWKGELTEVPFAEVLARLYREQQSGALLIRHERYKKLVFFRDGYPCVIRSNRLQECLGQMMLKAKVITEAELEASLAQMKTTGRQQGTVLVEMGCISPHSLKLMLDLQLQMKLYDLFGWERGSFKWKAGGELPPAPVSLEASTAALIWRGVQKKLRLARLTTLLALELDRYPAPSSDPLLRFQDMGLEEIDERLTASLKGEQSLRQIIAGAEHADLEHVHQLLYALKASGMLVFEERPRAVPALSVPPPAEDEAPRRLPPPPTCLEPEPEDDEPEEIDASEIEELDETGGAEPPDLSESEATMEADALPEGPPRPSGLTQVRRAIAERIEDLSGKDYFAILDVPRDAPRERITKAFLTLARKHHPDRVQGGDSTQVRSLSSDLFKLICQAHETLSDDRLRAEYLGRLEGQRESPSQLSARKTLDAEAAFKQGERALKRKAYGEAREAFERATALCPMEGEYQAYLGMTLYLEKPAHKPSLERAREELNRAVSLSPTLDIPHLYLAYVYRAMGHRQMAVGEFEAAVQCNPDCVEALRELRLLRLRRQAQKKKPGLFGKK